MEGLEKDPEDLLTARLRCGSNGTNRRTSPRSSGSAFESACAKSETSCARPDARAIIATDSAVGAFGASAE